MYKKTQTSLYILLSILIAGINLFPNRAIANNLSVSSVSITGQNTANQTADVQFNLSWDNSWRNEINYDAAWVFIKYSTDSGSTWQHAYLSTTDSDHSVSAGYEVKTGSSTVNSNTRGMGVFIQRSSAGTGSVSLSAVKLKWKWGQNGLSSTTSLGSKFLR